MHKIKSLLNVMCDILDLFLFLIKYIILLQTNRVKCKCELQEVYLYNKLIV